MLHAFRQIFPFLNTIGKKKEILFLGENNLFGLLGEKTNSLNKYRLINYKIEKDNNFKDLGDYILVKSPIIWLEGPYSHNMKYLQIIPYEYCLILENNPSIKYTSVQASQSVNWYTLHNSLHRWGNIRCA